MIKATVMIVEDDRIVARDLQNSLEHLGLNVSAIVSSGAEAVNGAKRDKPDLVLMDIMLNDKMGGIEAASKIHSQFNIPIVYLTAYSDEKVLEDAIQTDPSGYIIKPFEEKELNTTIKIALYKHKMEKRLKESQEWLSTTLRSVGDAVIATDIHECVEFINPVAEALTGWNQKDAKGKPLNDVLKIINDETREQIRDLLTEVIRKGKIRSMSNHFLLIARDGLEVPIDHSAAPIRGDKGQISGVVLVFRDVTERKEAEDALKKAKEEVEHVNRKLELAIENVTRMAARAEMANAAKSDFLANMSHEIRTPLNAVIGFTDILLDTKLDKNQIDYTTTIQKSGKSLLVLLNDILDLSKIEAGDLDFEEIDFDPELLVYDVCELIRPKIDSKPIELLCAIGDDLPSQVKGDPARFRQVLTNLFGNASKFTDTGEIELSIDCDRENDGRVRLHTTIRDTGIGIPEEKLTTIFAPFQQADSSMTRQYGGTGLGLAICKKISKLMSGDVWAESEVKRGTTFHFTAWFTKSENTSAKRRTPVSMSGKRVLVVEDNKRNLDIFRHLLESAGVKVGLLSHGEQVVPTLKRALDEGEPFDLCISNIRLPDTNGYEVAKQIRDPKHSFENLPLIAISSLTDRDARKCEEAGFKGFLSKPIQREKLFQMLESTLGKNKGVGEGDGIGRERIMTQYSVREEMKHSTRILLAEDNPVNQKLAEIILTKAGYQVEVVGDGVEAVEKYTTSPEDFDLILMDIQMPRQDGIDATKAIREKGFKSVPIIAMTAQAMKGAREECLGAGMNDYITKPIKRALVLDLLEKWVFRARSKIT